MSPSATPLAPGVHAGDGWHLEQPSRPLVLVWAVAAVVIVLGLGAAAVAEGHLVLGAFTLPLAFAFGALPFERLRPRVPPGLYAGELGHGLLVPSYPMRTTTIASLAILGVVLWSVPAVAVTSAVRGATHPAAAAASVVPFALGVAFLVGAYGGLRSRRRPSSGLLLTPSEVVLGDRRSPARFAWTDLDAVRPHWTVAGPQRSAFSGRGDLVRNWLSFVVPRESVQGPGPTRHAAGTDQPTLLADTLAVEPEVVLALCDYYLSHPEARDELTTTTATDRVATVARTVSL